MKKNAVLLTSLICFLASVNAEEDADSVISSQEANYDGEKLSLSGNVSLDHTFGLMKADEAILDKAVENRDFPFSAIHLKEKVEVHPSSSGILNCQTADFDFIQMLAHFSGKEEEKVSFKEELKSKKGKKNQILFETLEADMKIKAQDKAKVGHAYSIESIESKQRSSFYLNDKVVIEAPHTIFRRGKGTNLQFEGEVVAIGNEAEPCILKHEEDLITATHLQMDLASESIALAHAKGKITSLNSDEPIQFISDRVLWKEKDNSLQLQGHVQCKEADLGFLLAENLLKLSFEMQEGKKELSKIEAEGATKLKFEDIQHQTIHELYCSKSIHMDRKKLQTTLLAEPDKPIRYMHPSGVIFASQAFIQYSANDKAIKPSQANLSGHIKLISSDDKKPKVCIADKLEFSFDNQSMVLFADTGKRVLYWDPMAGVSISATEVHITRDANTQQDEVRGVGNVRFSFSDAEKEVLKKHYPQYSR